MPILFSRERGCCLFLGLALAGCHRGLPYEGKSVAQLEAMLRDADPRVQTQGAFGLGRHGAEARSAIPLLAEKLKAPQPLVRQQAALALGQIGPDAATAVPALVEALADKEWAVRRQAVLALGGIGSAAQPALPALDQLARDPDSLVRKAVQEARPKIAGGNEGAVR